MKKIKSHAPELLMAAEKYDLPKLKILAETSMRKSLKLENVLWNASHAHIHNGQSVVSAAIQMIVDQFAQVLELPDWKNFVKNHPELLAKVHKKLANILRAWDFFWKIEIGFELVLLLQWMSEIWTFGFQTLPKSELFGVPITNEIFCEIRMI